METKGKKFGRRELVLTGVLILAVAGTIFIWYKYFGGKSIDTAVVEKTAPPSLASQVQNQDAKDIFAAIEIINYTRLDTEFFNSQKFADLEEFLVSIPNVEPRQQSFKFIFAPEAVQQQQKK